MIGQSALESHRLITESTVQLYRYNRTVPSVHISMISAEKKQEAEPSLFSLLLQLRQRWSLERGVPTGAVRSINPSTRDLKRRIYFLIFFTHL